MPKGLMTLEYLLINQITVILFSFNVCNIGGNLNANTQKNYTLYFDNLTNSNSMKSSCSSTPHPTYGNIVPA